MQINLLNWSTTFLTNFLFLFNCRKVHKNETDGETYYPPVKLHDFNDHVSTMFLEFFTILHT